MYSSVNPPVPFETVPTNSLKVVCEGESAVLGHPRVYLDINPDMGRIACPYCSREFVYQGAS